MRYDHIFYTPTASIPPQPNGTVVEYYLTATDTFGNRNREPKLHNYYFWVHKPLAPNNISLSPVEKSVVNIEWENPSEEIYYDYGIPSKSYLLAPGEIAAVRFTPQYYPSHIRRIKFYVANSTGKNEIKYSMKCEEDYYELQIYVFETDSLGEPNSPIIGPYFVSVEGGVGWRSILLDSLSLILNEGEFYLGISNQNSTVYIYGDANINGAMRSRIFDSSEWQVDSMIGNILIRTELEYLPDTSRSYSSLIGYRILRKHQQDSSFVIIRDSLVVNSLNDTDLIDESYYLYRVSAIYDDPYNIVESDEIALWSDWSAPFFEKVEISPNTDSSILFKVKVTDWLGILWDSLYFKNDSDSVFTGITHDFFDSVYYYTIPYQPEDSLFYYLCAVDYSLWQNYARYPDSGYACYYMASTGIEDDVPRVFSLSQNFPNPFINNTIIKYGLPKKVGVRLCVYNSAGQLVSILENGEKEAGYYTVKWSGEEKNLASGIYFIRLTAGRFTKTRKIVLIK